MSVGCGPGQSCCGSCSGGSAGLGGAPLTSDQRVMAVSKVLVDYVIQMLASGQPFYITPEINSDVLTYESVMAEMSAPTTSLKGMGGFFDSIANIATKVVDNVVKIAPAAATLYGIKAGIDATKAQTSAALASQNVNLTGAAANNSVLAALGLNYTPNMLLIGGLGLLLVLVLRK